jgi:hypothetical protein
VGRSGLLSSQTRGGGRGGGGAEVPPGLPGRA